MPGAPNGPIRSRPARWSSSSSRPRAARVALQPTHGFARLLRARAIDRVAVIALSEHVDYWNRLGWKDAFSSAAMTARQGHYARALGSQVYTPQMVVDGEVEFIGSDRQAGTTAIRHAAASKKAAVTAEVAVATAVIDVRATITPGALDRLPDADVFVAHH